MNVPTVAVIAASVLGAACLAPRSGSSSPAPASGPAPGDPAAFQQRNVTANWEQNCSNCHGSRGEGGGAGTLTLLTAELADQSLDRRFFDAIKEGLPDTAMPEYGSTMSDEQIWALVVHVRELQERALRPPPTSAGGVNETRRAKFRVETVLEGQGLRTPWAVDWLPDGRMLVTNRPGKLFVARDGKVEAEVAGVPEVVELGQGGLMEVAVHPDYAKNGWIYLAYTEPASAVGGPGGGMTRVVRGKLALEPGKARWTGQQTVWKADPATYTRSGLHFGCKIVFDGKGHVFFGVGERGAMDLAQDLSRPNGKIYRVREDGSVPEDNPFVGRAGALPEVWSYGHRNPQGLVLDSDGTLWDTEHGPRGGDELNRVERGANYGWPLVSFGINYNDSPFRTPWPKEGAGIAMPAYRWLPSVGVCGLDLARGPMFPEWKGDLLAGGLSGQSVDRIRVREGKVVEVERVFSGLGRVRDVASGPGGAVYVVLNGPDKVVRLVEAP